VKTYKELQSTFKASGLSEFGVKLPRENSQKGQVLLFLFQNRGRVITKAEAERVVCGRMNKQTKDLQSLRHLGKQSGFNILQAGSIYEGRKLKKGEYVLVDLEKVNPYFNNSRRDESSLSFSLIKKRYNDSCATCGSTEGMPHRYSREIVVLEKGHKDPTMAMNNSNIIPQCQLCNKVAKDNWIFDEFGRVAKITPQGLLSRHSRKQKEEFLKVLIADLG
tara:strand:- start:524 stop:1183 length:660 start_codon:yes stop_codon:yes gene_type:complete